MIKKVLVLICFIFLLNCKSKTIGLIEGEPIKEEEFLVFKENYPNKSIDDFIRRKVVVYEAKKSKVDKDKEFISLKKKDEDEILKSLYIKKKSKIKPFSGEEAKKFYFTHREKRKAAHILTKTREECELAKNRIKAGEPFEKIAKETSIDNSTKDIGGELGYIRRGMTVKPFEDALFSGNKGDLLGPIKTEYGFHLILIKDIQQATEEEFEKNKDQIFKTMKLEQEKSAIEKVSFELRKKYPLKVYEETLSSDRTTEVKEGDEKMVAGEVVSEKITLKELKEFMRDVLNVSGEGHSLGVKTKTSFLEILADDKRILKEAKKEDLQKTKEFKLYLNDKLEDELYFYYKNKFLKNYKINDEELQNFYEEEKEKFKNISKIYIEQVICSDFSSATKGVDLAKKGVSLKEIYEKYGDKEATGNWDVGFVNFDLLKNVFNPTAIQSIQNGKDGEIIGPLKIEEGFIILKIKQKEYQGYKRFEEVKEKLKESYLLSKGDEIFDIFVEGLLSKTKVEVYFK